jgi:hypothetical protein
MRFEEEVPGHRLAQEPLAAPWAEAAVVLRAEQDAEVHEEARELARAEMAAVTLADRITSVAPGSFIELTLGDASTVSGCVEQATGDHLLLRDTWGLVLLPLHAIASVASLPPVMHDDAASSVRTTWRPVLRECFGRELRVSLGSPVPVITGSLTWVGSDHLSLRSDHGEITCAWPAVLAVRLPALD